MEHLENGAESEAVARCSNCRTSWDKIKRDGRVGCALCYEMFRAQLAEVMVRVQRETNHSGKAPRAAQKRLRRGENLRKRSANQLELLHNRLLNAIAAEKYEEAARLRDKIEALQDAAR